MPGRQAVLEAAAQMVARELGQKPRPLRLRPPDLNPPRDHAHLATRAAVKARVGGGLVERIGPPTPPETKPAEQAHGQCVPPGRLDVKWRSFEPVST